MKNLRLLRLLLLALLVASGWGLVGCKTTDESENEASIPWNRPKTWENGLPMGLGERER